MSALLDSAHTWFFESARHLLDGTLEVHLAEGIRGPTASMVNVSGAQIGPFYPVTIEPTSRTVRVQFPLVVAHFAIDESYPPTDSDVVKGSGRFLMTVEGTSFSTFIKSHTPFHDICTEPAIEYLLWSEDRMVYVLSHGVPVVDLTPGPADLSLRRGDTWSKT